MISKLLLWNRGYCCLVSSRLVMKSSALLGLSLLLQSSALRSSFRSSPLRVNHHQLNLIPEIHQALSHSGFDFNAITNQVQQSLLLADEAVSMYSKVDKTGFIGFFATYIEEAIDLGRSVVGSYGVSIILFTILVKVLTLPLTTAQLESTTKIQKLAPLQKQIQEKYAGDDTTKNQLLAQLYQAAQVNPLAGCLPALVQIPIFISLYRALTNLVAESKLGEAFLWIPSLEGPVYSRSAAEAGEWLKSIFSGNPLLGWPDTLAFLSLPIILYVSQSISQRLLQPPKDPNKVLSEQEQMSQSILNNLPLIVAFFSINVPAGLAVYWIVNNILTTLVTVAIKSSMKDDSFPPEVSQLMASVSLGKSRKDDKGDRSSGSRKETQREEVDSRPKAVGFAPPPRAVEKSAAAVGDDAARITPNSTDREGSADTQQSSGDSAQSPHEAPSESKPARKAKINSRVAAVNSVQSSVENDVNNS